MLPTYFVIWSLKKKSEDLHNKIHELESYTSQSLWKIHTDFPQHNKKIPQSSHKNTLQVLKLILRIKISRLWSEKGQVQGSGPCPPAGCSLLHPLLLSVGICVTNHCSAFHTKPHPGNPSANFPSLLNFATLLSRKNWSRKVFKPSKTFSRSCPKSHMANSMSCPLNPSLVHPMPAFRSKLDAGSCRAPLDQRDISTAQMRIKQIYRGRSVFPHSHGSPECLLHHHIPDKEKLKILLHFGSAPSY